MVAEATATPLAAAPWLDFANALLLSWNVAKLWQKPGSSTDTSVGHSAVMVVASSFLELDIIPPLLTESLPLLHLSFGVCASLISVALNIIVQGNGHDFAAFGV